jgi:hypothetical protein
MYLKKYTTAISCEISFPFGQELKSTYFICFLSVDLSLRNQIVSSNRETEWVSPTYHRRYEILLLRIVSRNNLQRCRDAAGAYSASCLGGVILALASSYFTQIETLWTRSRVKPVFFYFNKSIDRSMLYVVLSNNGVSMLGIDIVFTMLEASVWILKHL